MRLSEAMAAAPRIEIRVSAARGAASVVPGPPGDVAKVATRAAMAALPAVAAMTRYLMELGREGIFVFDAADLSARVAADGNQGLYVAPASDVDGSSGAWVRRYEGSISAEWFGLATAGTEAANTAVIDAMVDMLGDGPSPVVIKTATTPGKTFAMGSIEIEKGNLHFDTTGTKFTGAALAFVTSQLAPNVGIFGGGEWLNTGASDVPMFHLNGSGNFIHDRPLFEKNPDGGGYMGQIERFDATFDGADIDVRTKGGNGIFVEGPRHKIRAECKGRAVGADDCLVLKARQIATVDCDIIVWADGFSNAAAIGSEVGKLGVDDPLRAQRVSNNRIHVFARSCNRGFSAKPGAIDAGPAFDWRDGLVSDNDFHLHIVDEAGAKMVQAFVFTAARGAEISNNRCVVQARGRCSLDTRSPLVDFFLPDYAGTAAATIRDNMVVLHFTDPWRGVATGVVVAPLGAAPAFPFQNFVAMEKQNVAVGTFSGNRVRVFGTGCYKSGVLLGEGCDDGLTVEAAKLDWVNRDGSNLLGGMNALSRLIVGSDITMTNVGGQPYRIGPNGDVVCPELERESFLFAQVNAGNADEQYPWAAAHRCQLIEMRLRNNSNAAQSDADYTSLKYRNMGGSTNEFHIATTKITGGGGSAPAVALAQGVEAVIYRYRDVTDGTNLGQALFPKDAVLYQAKTDTGAGRTLTNARLRLRVAPY